jgi:chromosome segregation ATPase
MGKDYDPDNNPLNNVEKSLNSVGIAIRSDKDTFKSFSDVIDEVASHWNKYSDVQKNLIATQMAGTYQRNQFLALMSNYNDTLKIQSKETDSAGSAMKRYQTYAESTQAKLDDLKGSVQRFWQGTLNSNQINSAIGGLNSLVQTFSSITSKFGVIPTLLTGILPILTQFGKFKDFKFIDFTSASSSTSNFTQKVSILGTTLEDIGKKFKTSFGNFGSSYSENLNQIQGLNNTLNQMPTALERANASMKTLRQTTIVTTVATGALRVAEIALNASLTMGLSLAIGAIIQKLSDWANKDEILAQKNKDLLSSTNQSIQSHQSNMQMLSSMSDKYKEVSDRVELFRSKGLQPTSDDLQSLGEMNDQIAGKFPDLVSGTDSFGHAILNLNGNLTDLIAKEKEAAKSDAQKIIDNGGFKEESDNTITRAKERIKELSGQVNLGDTFKDDFTHPIQSLKDIFANSSQSKSMIKQLNQEITDAQKGYQKIIPYILQVNSGYSKLNPSIQTAIKNWAMQDTEFSRMSGKQMQSQVDNMIKLYSSNKNLPIINQIKDLNDLAKNGAVPIDNYKKQSSDLINALKKVSGTNLSTSQLKKMFNIDTSKLPKSEADIKVFTKSISQMKDELKSDATQIQKYQKVLNDIKSTGKLSDDDKSFISQDPTLIPYMNNIGKLTDVLSQKISNLKQSATGVFAVMDIKTHIDNLNNLIQTYKTLSQRHNLSDQEQKTLANTILQLTQNVDGLVVSKNKDGQATITNIQVAKDRVTSLDAEAQYLNLVSKVGVDKANSTIQAEIKQTENQITNSKTRIQQYQNEIESIKNLINFIESLPIVGGAISSALGLEDKLGKYNSQYKAETDKIKKSEQIIKGLQEQLKVAPQATEDWNKYLSQSQNAMNGLTDSINNGTKSNKDYTTSEDDNTKAKDANTQATELNSAMQKEATQAVKEATNAMKDYQDQIQALENTTKDYDYELSTLNDHSDKYIATLEKKKQALQQELTLTQQAAAYGKAQANSLNSQANSYAGINYTISGTGSGGSGTQWTGKYSSWINDAASKNGLDPLLIAAIIQIESGFNPSAYNSSSGATGLGQFLGSTAREVGINPWDAQQSVYGLASYLKQRINQAGSVKGGIMGYGEGTTAYYNKVMSAYNKFAGGATVSGDTGGVVSGEDASNTLASGADSLQSQVESLQGNVDTLKQEIDQITEDKIKAKEGQFDDQVTEWQKKISIVKTEADMYNDGAQAKTDSLKVEWQDINQEYNVMEQKRKYLYDAITKGGYNEHILEFLNKDMADLMDTEQQTIQTLHQVFDEWIKSEYQSKIQIYQDKYDELNKQFDLLDTKDKNDYKDKLDLAKQELVQQENILAGEKDELATVTDLLNKEKNDTTKQVWESEIKTINSSIADTQKNLAEIQNTIDELDLDNKLKQYADDNTNLKNQLSQLDSATDKAYANKIDIVNKIMANDEKQNEIVSQRIKLLQDEASRFADGSEEKITLLDQINDLQQKQNDIQQDRID